MLDKWIMSRLALCVKLTDSNIAAYTFEPATRAIYNFWLYEFCDIYLEAAKPVMMQGTLMFVRIF